MADIFKRSYSDKDTFEFGKELGEKAKPGEVYCLDGDLGTGKTVFAQGFAAGLGIKEPVSSPTFTILKEYHDGRIPLYHFDVYRIGSEDEMDEIGYYDLIDGDGVCLIEWSALIRGILPPHYIRIGISKDMDEGYNYRAIEVERK